MEIQGIDVLQMSEASIMLHLPHLPPEFGNLESFDANKIESSG